jgi:diguanylate cyclase (GGDEF)-like protein
VREAGQPSHKSHPTAGSLRPRRMTLATRLSARSLVNLGAIVTALLCGLGVPLLYLFYEYEERAELLEFKAKLAAVAASRFISQHPLSWREQGREIAEVVTLPQLGEEPLQQRLMDTQGTVISASGPTTISPPLLRRTAPVYVDGAPIGLVEIAIPLDLVLWRTALTAIASGAISLAAFLAFLHFPLRTLDRTLNELEGNNRRFDAALANISQGLCIFDGDNRLVACNARYRQMYDLSEGQTARGTPLRELLAHRWRRGTFPPALNIECYIDDLIGHLRDEGRWSTVTQLRDGRFVAVASSPMPGGGWVATHDDITELKEREQLALRQNMRFDTAINNMSHGLSMFDSHQRLVVCNKQYADLYRVPEKLTRPGTTLHELLEARQTSNLIDAELLAAMAATPNANKPAVGVYELRDGRSILIRHQPMSRGGWVATHEDITEQRRTEAKIAHLAHHDALTDLPNRTLLNKCLGEACGELGEDNSIAVLCLDLDRFKEVNDTLGHATGDALLKTIAQRLQECAHEHDTVARIGGDEFAIVQTNAVQPDSATKLASRIIEAVTAPYEIDGHQILIGTSVGISVGPDDSENAAELLKNADLALYQVKGQGRGSYRFFEPAMDARMHARRQLEIDLRRALSDSAFELHFQPILNLDDNRVSGFEALIRWNHPTRGWVEPSEFIPLAEEIGLITPVGEWVLTAACKAAAEWPADIGVSVNLSALQFKQGGLLQAVAGALTLTHLAPARLELEITESTLLENTDKILGMLGHLRELGVRIAMDDFGIGFSSLSSLSRFHFDKIKIDKSFVAGLGKNEHSAAIIEAVATLGASMGMTTTAEGIETLDQFMWLRAVGITEAQGYFISRPQPAAHIATMVAAAASSARTAA